MTRAGTIPLSDIEWIQVHFNTKRRKSTKSGLQQLLADAGGDIIMNAAIFLRNGAPCCHLKADGVVKCQPSYTAWGISWNEASDFCVERVASGKRNYMECVHAIIGGKKIEPMNYGKDMAYACNRTAVGTKDGRFAYYCTEDNLTPEALRDRLFAAGWSDAIMMDGGGSACCMDKNGNGFAGDGRYIPFYLVVKLKETDNEPKGVVPMVEIYAYSLKKDGNKKLSAHFQVKEFACQDGSDTVFIARELPMICEYIRMRTGKAFTPNSAYRTPAYNKKVGGVDDSLHTHGAAADIPKLSGYTPSKMAEIAREIMPDWGGVGIYDWGIHVDVRESKSDWNG
jgi:hypothetical protein